MKTASMISTGLHVAALVFAVVSVSGKSLEVTPAESLPVDIISEKQFSQLTKGVKEAKQADMPRPLVEKIAPETKSIDESKARIDTKPEIKATQQQAAPPPQPEQKVEKKESRPAEKPPEQLADNKAEAIQQKTRETKVQPAPTPPKKPPQKEQPKFDADKIAALLDQKEPRRNAATGDQINNNPSLGKAEATASTLSQSEIDAFRKRITDCWNPPVGMDSAQDLQVVFRVMFNPDGTVKRGPDVVGGKPVLGGPAFAESARRAILQCQPYTMLRRETYKNWGDMELAFRPSDMFR